MARKMSDWSLLSLFGMHKSATLRPLIDLDLPRREDIAMVPSDEYFRNERIYEMRANDLIRKYGALVCRIFPKGRDRAYKRRIMSYAECRAYIMGEIAKNPDLPHEILVDEYLGERGGAVISEVRNGIPRVVLEDADDRAKVIYGTGKPGEIRRVWYNPLEKLSFQGSDNASPDFHRTAFEALAPLKLARGEYMPFYGEFFIPEQSDRVTFVEAMIDKRLLKEMGIIDASAASPA